MNVHEEDSRVVKEEVIVKGSHFDAMIEQGGKDRIDFVLRQDEVAHENFGPAVAFGHGDPASEAKWCWRRLPGDRDMQIAAGDIDFQDVGFEIAGASQQGENFLIFLRGLLGRSRDGLECKYGETENQYAPSASEFHCDSPAIILLLRVG